MVQYKCNQCFKIFTHKGDYNRHLSRKKPCKFASNVDSKIVFYKCKKCDIKFDRKDNYRRHIKKCIILCEKNNINNKINNGSIITGNNGPIITGNNNKIIINQYNLVPFAKDGIDCLTLPERVAIFSSNENPMEMIIVEVNMNPDKKNHHNVGYTDQHFGYGIIFDGNRWITERIDVILEVLFESKEKDLLKIYEEIKDFLLDDTKNTIKNTLNNLSEILSPTNKINATAKKKLIAHLKKHFYNNRHLVLDAKKHTDNNTINNDHKYNFKNILKEGYTIEDVAKGILEKKRINLKKEIAKSILKELSDDINESEFNALTNIINECTSIKNLSIITNLLNKTFCFKNKINEKIIQNKLRESEIIDKFLFPK